MQLATRSQLEFNMSDTDFSANYGHSAPFRPQRIGGTAMVGGVHLSTGAFGTGSFWQLFITGLALVSIGAGAMVLSYIILWEIGRVVGLPLIAVHLQLLSPMAVPGFVGWEIFINVLVFASFLVIVRLTPLAGYHGAEHKVVHAIERYGFPTLELSRRMPRPHKRCGTTLLAGILPAFLIAAPLLIIMPGLALIVVLLGWMSRYRVGHLIQEYLTTKEPTDAQLRAGLQAGHELLSQWRRHPYQYVTPLVSFWRRGFIPMLLGVVAAMQLFSWVYQHLHLWLDWGL